MNRGALFFAYVSWQVIAYMLRLQNLFSNQHYGQSRRLCGYFDRLFQRNTPFNVRKIAFITKILSACRESQSVTNFVAQWAIASNARYFLIYR